MSSGLYILNYFFWIIEEILFQTIILKAMLQNKNIIPSLCMGFLSENLIPNVYADTHMTLSHRQTASHLFLVFFNQHIFYPSPALSIPCTVTQIRE